MITQIQIPLAFENMEEATIGEWLVEEGQQVNKEQPLCELITEKTTFEFSSPVEGVVRLIALPAKSVAAVGEIICLIGEPQDELPDLETVKSASEQASGKSTFERSIVKSTLAKRNDRIRATPAARRAAREHGLSLDEIAAVFPDKVLIEDDVNNFRKKR
jgi:pyruvate/2-oxoglutarate dehydrogenase complex dihydrolipoamide acyltransferase (E2) component